MPARVRPGPHHSSHYDLRLSTQRHPDPDLAFMHRDMVRQHSVDPYRAHSLGKPDYSTQLPPPQE